MEMLIIEKQALDELTGSIEMLKIKVDSLYCNSGIAPQKWMDNQQACIRLSASKGTLQNLRESGVLPYTKIGGKIFYKPADIERMFLMNYKQS